MSRIKASLDHKGIRRLIWLVLALFILLGYSLQSAAGSVNYSLLMESDTTVTSPPVVLQNGTAGTSTIYTNSTSAKVSVVAPVSAYDFVDNNMSNVDSNASIGTHSNFTAQQYGPDLINDTLTEENAGVSESMWLYANADDESKTDWTRVGTNPYLDAIDYTTSYIYATGNNKLVGDFSFTDSGKSVESINSVTVQIYAQQSVSKNLEVFVWDGSTWTSLGQQVLTTSWRWENFTATTVLDTWTKIDGAKIYLRTTSAAGNYEVDCARLQVDYTPPDYELDLEVQWTNTNYTRTNEELCIKTGTTDAEDIEVYVWNVTGSSWHLVFNDLAANTWNNISVSDYLTESNFTIRFKAGNETGDATQSSWDIDASLLHVWNDIEDYVDNNTSDMDGSGGDIGTHSNFTAQKYGPDFVNDTLTEEDIGVEPLELWVDGFTADEILWNEVGTSPYLDAIDYATNYIWAAATDTEYEGKFNFANSSDLGTINDVKICLYAMNEAGGDDEIEVYLYNSTGGPYSIVQFAPTAGSWGWYNYSCLSTLSSWTEVNNGQLRVRAEKILGGGNVYIDAALILVNYTGYNYLLDLEVQWTNVDYDEANEELCIYGGTMASEDILVDIWNTTTSTWDNAFTNLTANGWKNYSVTSWLTSTNFTIRFRDGNQTGDGTQSSWNIDATLLHVWTEDYAHSYDYVLRVNNTLTDSWQIRLTKYADSNIDRLENCTIYFHNSSDGTSRQIYIQDGSYTNQTGPWYDLGDSETIYIAMTLEANGTGTSYIYTYLEIRTPNTTTYVQYVITFEIT